LENIQLKLLFERLGHESRAVLWVGSRFPHKASSLQPGNNKPCVPLAEVTLVLQDASRDGPTQAGAQLSENRLKTAGDLLDQVISQLTEELC